MIHAKAPPYKIQPTQAFKEGWNILALEQHAMPEDPRNLNITEQLQTIKTSDARVIIMFTAIQYAPYIFREAYDMKMLGKGYAWILLDATGDLEFIYDRSMPQGYPFYLRGLLTIRPISEDGAKFRSFADMWQNNMIRRRPFDSHFTDAILLFAHALRESRRAGIDLAPRKLSPADNHEAKLPTWLMGDKFLKLLLTQTFDGLTRHIVFDQGSHIPRDLEFGIYNIQFSNNMKLKVGSWNPHDRLTLTHNITWLGRYEEQLHDLPQALAGRKFKIVTKNSPPFVMVGWDQKRQRPTFKGYLIDLLEKLRMELQFEYELYQVKTSLQYGHILSKLSYLFEKHIDHLITCD